MLSEKEGKFWVWWNAYDRGKWAFDDTVNDVVKAAFLAGMEAAQQGVHFDPPSALVCTCSPVNSVHYKDCPLANSAGK